MTKTIFILAILACLCANVSEAQVTAQWTSVYNGISSDTDQVAAIAVDNSGNVFVTGFSKGAGTGKDIATIKYNSEGQQQWVSRYNNSDANGNDVPTAIAFDNSGNVYVTGQSYGNGTFSDIITIKYSSDGNELWNDRYNGEGSDVDGGTAIALDNSGNVIVTGYSVGAITSEDYTTIKYNSSGARQWIAKYNKPTESDIDIATSVVLDNSGNVYVTGYSVGNNTLEDIAVVKYDPSGNEMWVTRYNGNGNSYDIATGLAIDANSNILVSGFTHSTTNEEDYVVIKLNADGAEQWIRTYNGTASSYDITAGIATDNLGNVFVSGFSYGGDSQENYTTIKYGSDGALIWERSYNGTGDSYDIATAIKTDNSGNVYVTGYSLDDVTSEDYVTLKYNTNGDLIWTEKFNGPANGGDIANSLAVDASNNVYVSGFSYEGATSIDYITLKYSQTVGISSVNTELASGFVLQQNYPNPFNPATLIGYDLPISSFVTFEVFSTAGVRVATLVNERQSPGHHDVSFAASEIPSGLYVYRMTATNPSTGWSVSKSKKMMLVK